MKEVRGCLVYGNVSFSKNACEAITFKEFEKEYGDILKGFDLKSAYKELGGKLRVSKKDKVEDSEQD